MEIPTKIQENLAVYSMYNPNQGTASNIKFETIICYNTNMMNVRHKSISSHVAKT
jgi:hypothetical protein